MLISLACEASAKEFSVIENLPEFTLSYLYTTNIVLSYLYYILRVLVTIPSLVDAVIESNSFW